ncbi:MAG: NADH:flavin oxidoreductase, partial [Deltaproteobacteria bacterium]
MGRSSMKLTEPGKIGSMTLRNRIIMPAMGTNLANPDGTVSQHLIDYYEARAAGGVGLVITEVVTPDERGQCIHCELGGYRDNFVPGLSRLVRAIKSQGAKCVLQIAHAGAFASSQVTGMKPLAPSPVPCSLTGETPEEATIFEIREIVEKYAQLAVRAKTAGFDGVEIHGAHGYLPLQFLSPYTNRRNDEYGGSLEGRLMFPRELVRAIRSAVGPSFPIIYRLSGEEYVPNGLELEDTKKVAQVL